VGDAEEPRRHVVYAGSQSPTDGTGKKGESTRRAPRIQRRADYPRPARNARQVGAGLPLVGWARPRPNCRVPVDPRSIHARARRARKRAKLSPVTLHEARRDSDAAEKELESACRPSTRISARPSAWPARNGGVGSGL